MSLATAVGLGEQLLGVVEQRELLLQVAGELGVLDRVRFGLGGVQHVAGGLELRPQGVVDLLTRATGELPFVEEPSVVGDRRGALRRERLGALDQRLLAGARVAVGGVEFGEERLAVRLDRRASRPESLPELVALVLGQAGSVLLLRLPAGEQLIELRGDLLPLRLRRVLSGEGLDLGDESLTLDEGCRGRLLRLGGLLLGELADAALQLLESGVEGGRSPTAFAVVTVSRSEAIAFATSWAGAPPRTRCSSRPT